MTTTGEKVEPFVGKPVAESAGRQEFSLRVAILVALTFFPYLAIPVGESTSIGLALLFGLAFAGEVLTRPQLLIPFLVVVTTPIVMLFVQVLLGRSLGGVVQTGVWSLQLMSFGAVAAAVVVSAQTVRATLRVLLIVAAVYAVVQKFFLDSGVLPFVWLYDVPGYWSVPDNVDEIVEYVRRPFGWFPEPSFMAGTFALASTALLLLGYLARHRPSVADLSAVMLAGVAMTLSESGSALLTLPALAALAVLPFSSRLRKVVFVLGGMGLWGLLATGVLESRQSTPDASWNNRLASIIGGARYILEDPWALLFGIGTGGSTFLYEHRLIPLSGLAVSDPLDDIFSVVGAVVMANGVIAGAIVLGVLLGPIIQAFTRRTSWFFGALAVSVWIVVATFTISYDSAIWIWALPGVCLGTLVPASVTGRRPPSVRTGDHTCKAVS